MGNSASAPSGPKFGPKATYTSLASIGGEHGQQIPEVLPTGNLRGFESQLKEMRKPALISKAEMVGVDATLIDECSHEPGKDRLIEAILNRSGMPSGNFDRETDYNTQPLFIKMLPPFFGRGQTVDVTNDPRNFEDSTLTKRYASFDSIVVGATCLASLACTVCITVLTAETQSNWAALASYVCFIVAFLLNLFCVSIITQQKYQIIRLSTSGPHGFEIAKSYYLNKNIMKLRHVSVQGFTFSLPLFMFAVGLVTFDFAYSYAPYIASACLGVTILLGLVVVCTINRQNVAFRHYYGVAKQFSQPLRLHMHGVNRRNNDGDELYN